MIIINPNKRKPSLKSILKELSKTSYGDFIADINLTKKFLRHSILTSKIGSNEFIRYLNYLTVTPAHLVVFYRQNGVFIFRFEKDLMKISEYGFLFLIIWIKKVIEGIEDEKQIHLIHKEIHKCIKK